MRSFYSCGQLSEMGFDEMVGTYSTTRLAVNTTGSKVSLVSFMPLPLKPAVSDHVTFVLQHVVEQVSQGFVVKCDLCAYLHGRMFSLMHMKQVGSVLWPCAMPGLDASRSSRLIKKRT